MAFRLAIPDGELWDEGTERFIVTKGRELCLEHSLLSLSKWESRWEKPFLSTAAKTRDETVDYIRCMTLTRDVDPNLYAFLTDADIRMVDAYIAAPMTATTVRETGEKKNNKLVTSELIYYWMIVRGIPFECEKWHLNRLLMLIRVFDAESQPPKKMSRRDIQRQYQEWNRKRREQWNTKG